jgi:O-antigen biosynthesis protein WbqV
VIAKQWLTLGRPQVAFLHDVVMAAASFNVSLFLRLGTDLFDYDSRLVGQGTILFTAVAAAVFVSMRLYAGIWRYASLSDLMAILKAVTLAILIFLPLMFLITRLEDYPRSTLFINWFVLMALLGGPRFLYRLLKDRRLGLLVPGRRVDLRALLDGRGAADAMRRVPVLLVGAGDEAELFIRAVNLAPASPYLAVGILDDKGTRIGRDIHGVRVLGGLADVARVMADLERDGARPQRLILTRSTMDGARVRSLLETADALGVSLSRLPRLTDFKAGIAERIEIKPIAVEDLLGRAQTVLDRGAMKALIAGRRVLVTGAGGTIGNELVRQVAEFAPGRIALLDSSEFHLYSADLDLSERHPELDRAAHLADVRDARRIAAVMVAEKPEIVFHAAALKHVPMVEAHPVEGVLTNVVGTRIVADACRAAGARAMVLISTDKAVNPTSVMGATKRVAEAYCQALDIESARKREGTRFVTVRFGNVLGSTGSVVPLFQRQLAQGGPLTVTHRDMKRYFMTVREAVELVLEASALGAREDADEGKIYVLDMGEPVRILDLARQMVLLAGLRPGRDVEIAFTGPRPGEKLFEEVLHPSEALVPTEYAGILLAAPRIADRALIARAIDELAAAARAGSAPDCLDIMRRLVPEYRAGGPPAALAATT